MEKNKRALITGITGFVGKWLSEHLIYKGYEVYGLDRWSSCPYPDITYKQIDILDTAGMAGFLSAVKPGSVYHLAAISYLPEADVSPRHALEINISGTISLLDAVRQSCPQAETLLIGSSKQYNDNIDSDCVSEEIYPDPTNFYGISKYAGELIGKQYVRQFGMNIKMTRSFNHTGPGQSPRFVCSDWAKQVSEISMGSQPVISVGNLQSIIDFSDVRDVVRAYVLILERGTNGAAYNVCSGKGISLERILNYLISKSPKEISVRTEDKKLRAHKTNRKMIGDNSKLKRDTSWQASIPIEKTLDDLLNFWCQELEKTH